MGPRLGSANPVRLSVLNSCKLISSPTFHSWRKKTKTKKQNKRCLGSKVHPLKLKYSGSSNGAHTVVWLRTAPPWRKPRRLISAPGNTEEKAGGVFSTKTCAGVRGQMLWKGNGTPGARAGPRFGAVTRSRTRAPRSPARPRKTIYLSPPKVCAGLHPCRVLASLPRGLPPWLRVEIGRQLPLLCICAPQSWRRNDGKSEGWELKTLGHEFHQTDYRVIFIL